MLSSSTHVTLSDDAKVASTTMELHAERKAPNSPRHSTSHGPPLGHVMLTPSHALEAAAWHRNVSDAALDASTVMPLHRSLPYELVKWSLFHGYMSGNTPLNPYSPTHDTAQCRPYGHSMSVSRQADVPVALHEKSSDAAAIPRTLSPWHVLLCWIGKVTPLAMAGSGWAYSNSGSAHSTTHDACAPHV